MNLKKDNLSLTIIVPVYNGEQFLVETITSCLNQSIQADSIIIINDFSNDSSDQIIETFKSLDYLKIINNSKNLGLGLTLLKAAEIATTEYILILGQDDIIPSDYIEKNYDLLKLKPVLLHTPFTFIDYKGEKSNTKKNINDLAKFFRIENNYLLTLGNIISTVGIIVDRVKFCEFGIFQNIEFINDGKEFIITYSEYNTWINISKTGKIIYNNNTRTFYRIHNSSMTSRIGSNIYKLYDYEKNIRQNYRTELLRKTSLVKVFSFIFLIYFPFKIYSTIRRIFTNNY